MGWATIDSKAARTHLLAAVRGQVEREHGEEADAHAGDDDVYGVEERLPAHRYVEGYIQVRLVAACVELFVPGRRSRGGGEEKGTRGMKIRRMNSGILFKWHLN